VHTDLPQRHANDGVGKHGLDDLGPKQSPRDAAQPRMPTADDSIDDHNNRKRLQMLGVKPRCDDAAGLRDHLRDLRVERNAAVGPALLTGQNPCPAAIAAGLTKRVR